jgi:circadian clock protein KaiB
MVKQKEELRKEDVTRLFEQAGEKKGGKYVLNLYVAGTTPRSINAINTIKRLAEEHLKGKYELNVIDIFQQPLFAKEGQIIAAPTLIKKLPPPLKRFIGDMSNTKKIIAGLEIHEKKEHDGKEKTRKRV